MPNYLIYSDLHIRSKGPASRRDDYQATALSKLSYLYSLKESHAVDLYLNLGDVFHFKEPNRTPYHTTLALAQVIGSHPTALVLGNHDLQPSGIQSLPKQPVSILTYTNSISIEPTISLGQDTLYLVHYDHDVIDRLLCLKRSNRSGRHIILTHASITPNGEFNSFPYCELLPLAERGFDFLLYGHMHKSWGVYKVGNMFVYSLPAVMRGSIADVDILVPPSAILLTDDGLYQVPIPHVPPEDAFRYASRALKKRTTKHLEDFTAALNSLTMTASSREEALRKLAQDLEPEVYKTVIDYLRRV